MFSKIVRPMLRVDLERVVQIETQLFSDPWTHDDFLQELRKSNCFGYVAEHRQCVVGYMLIQGFGDRIEIVNLGVEHGFQRHGFGKKLVEKAIGLTEHNRKPVLRANVDERCLDAQLFLKQSGFLATEILDEDPVLYRMERKIKVPFYC